MKQKSIKTLRNKLKNEIGLITITFQFNNDKIFKMSQLMKDNFGTPISKETFVENKNLLLNIMNKFIDLLVSNETKIN